MTRQSERQRSVCRDCPHKRWAIWVCPDCGVRKLDGIDMVIHQRDCNGAFVAVDVVPAEQLRGAVEDRDEAIALLRTAMGPNKDRDEWFGRRRRLLDRFPDGGR